MSGGFRSASFRGALLALLAALPFPAGAAATELSAAARRMAEWAIASGDAGGLPFVIVDKQSARVIAFDTSGTAIAATPALIGLAVGDDNVPGIGAMRLADIAPGQRITPSGRFEAHLGANLAGHRILWVDYESALSLHPVATGNVAEQRLRRMATPTIADNRISYGCINVPADFYARTIEPLFAPADGIVYILPETRPLDELLRPQG